MQDVKNVVVHNLSVYAYIKICNLEGTLDVSNDHNCNMFLLCYCCSLEWSQLIYSCLELQLNKLDDFITLKQTKNSRFLFQEIPLIHFSIAQAKFFINVLAEPAEVVRNQKISSSFFLPNHDVMCNL